MKRATPSEPSLVFYHSLAIDAATATAERTLDLAAEGLVTRGDLLQTWYELSAAHLRARQLGRDLGVSPLRPYLARTLRTQRRLLRALRAAIAAREREPAPGTGGPSRPIRA
jgi:hypothetical protein